MRSLESSCAQELNRCAWRMDILVLLKRRYAQRVHVVRECQFSAQFRRGKILSRIFSSFRQLLEDDCSLYVPEVVDTLSTKRVLTTEFVDGSSLDKIADWDKTIVNKVSSYSHF